MQAWQLLCSVLQTVYHYIPFQNVTVHPCIQADNQSSSLHISFSYGSHSWKNSIQANLLVAADPPHTVKGKRNTKYECNINYLQVYTECTLEHIEELWEHTEVP